SGVQVRQVFGMGSGEHGLQHGQAALDLICSEHGRGHADTAKGGVIFDATQGEMVPSSPSCSTSAKTAAPIFSERPFRGCPTLQWMAMSPGICRRGSGLVVFPCPSA